MSAAAPTMDGEIPQAERALAGGRGRVRGCYQSALNDNAKLAGSITYEIAVGPTGTIASVDVGESDGLAPSVVDCVRGVLRSLVFEPPIGGRTAHVSGAFRFSPQLPGGPSESGGGGVPAFPRLTP